MLAICLGLDWFRSYLSDRSQVVEVDGKITKVPKTLSHGAPQGSILGPLLFIVFINDMPNCLTKGQSIFLADDTTILIAHTKYYTLINIGNEQLTRLNEWLITNKLILNAKKTKAVIFISRGKTTPPYPQHPKSTR